jgi:hypothetical protein
MGNLIGPNGMAPMTSAVRAHSGIAALNAEGCEIPFRF